MESGDTEKKASGFWEQSRSTPVTQIEVTLTDLPHVCCSLVALSFFDGLRTTMLQARIRAQNKNGVQQRGSIYVGVALSCTLYNHFLVKGTAPAKKKPICEKMKINT